MALLADRYNDIHALIQRYNTIARVFSGGNATQDYPAIDDSNDLLYGELGNFLCGNGTSMASIPRMFYTQYMTYGYTGYEPYRWLLARDPTDISELQSYTYSDMDNFLSGYFGFTLSHGTFMQDWMSNTLLHPISEVVRPKCEILHQIPLRHSPGIRN